MAASSTWSAPRALVRRRTGLALFVGITGVVLALAVAGIATYQAWRAPDAFQRTLVGGQLSIRMEARTDAVIYYEGQPVPTLAALSLTLRSPDGAPVPITAYEGTTNYDRNNVLATAVARFRSTDAGLYQLVSAAPAGWASVAVGQDLAGPVFLGLGLAAAIAVAAILLAFAVLALPGRSTDTP